MGTLRPKYILHGYMEPYRDNEQYHFALVPYYIYNMGKYIPKPYSSYSGP